MSGASRPPGWPGPRTAVAAVVGTPIRHSRSPAIFNAAFAACDLDWAFLAFEAAEAEAVLAAARALGIRGLSVTMPLKAPLARLVDRLTPVAEALGAVNSVRLSPPESGPVSQSGPESQSGPVPQHRSAVAEGDSTDGPGLLDALAAERGWRPAGARCAVIGAGDAARAVVLALAGGGAASVTVVGRSQGRAQAAAGLAGRVGACGPLAAVGDADAVFNATPVGMADTPGAGESPVPPELLRPGQLVVDLVYHPMHTPLLVSAEAQGAVTMGGLPMLVHQAARQFAWWTGLEPPLEAMKAAAAG